MANVVFTEPAEYIEKVNGNGWNQTSKSLKIWRFLLPVCQSVFGCAMKMRSKR